VNAIQSTVRDILLVCVAFVLCVGAMVVGLLFGVFDLIRKGLRK
jgi:hypothetical protein